MNRCPAAKNPPSGVRFWVVFFLGGGGTCKPQWTSAGEIAAKGEWELPVNMSKPGGFKMSNVQNPVDIPLYWLVNRDPHSGLL